MSGCSCFRQTAIGPAFQFDDFYVTCMCECIMHLKKNNHSCQLHSDQHKFILEHRNLSTTNIPTHYGSGIMFGIEIEVEVKDQVAVLDQFFLHDYYVVKLETSVPNGLEFVSAPMSFYYHAVQMRKLYDWFHKLNMREKTVWSSEKTGIHIHIQKSAISEENLQWLAKYLMGNQTEVDKFAGRIQNRFCVRTLFTRNALKNTAIRMTPETIEIRIFATFMDYTSVIQRLAVINRVLHTA